MRKKLLALFSTIFIGLSAVSCTGPIIPYTPVSESTKAVFNEAGEKANLVKETVSYSTVGQAENKETLSKKGLYRHNEGEQLNHFYYLSKIDFLSSLNFGLYIFNNVNYIINFCYDKEQVALEQPVYSLVDNDLNYQYREALKKVGGKTEFRYVTIPEEGGYSFNVDWKRENNSSKLPHDINYEGTVFVNGHVETNESNLPTRMEITSYTENYSSYISLMRYDFVNNKFYILVFNRNDRDGTLGSLGYIVDKYNNGQLTFEDMVEAKLHKLEFATGNITSDIDNLDYVGYSYIFWEEKADDYSYDEFKAGFDDIVNQLGSYKIRTSADRMNYSFQKVEFCNEALNYGLNSTKLFATPDDKGYYPFVEKDKFVSMLTKAKEDYPLYEKSFSLLIEKLASVSDENYACEYSDNDISFLYTRDEKYNKTLNTYLVDSFAPVIIDNVNSVEFNLSIEGDTIVAELPPEHVFPYNIFDEPGREYLFKYYPTFWNMPTLNVTETKEKDFLGKYDTYTILTELSNYYCSVHQKDEVVGYVKETNFLVDDDRYSILVNGKDRGISLPLSVSYNFLTEDTFTMKEYHRDEYSYEYSELFGKPVCTEYKRYDDIGGTLTLSSKTRNEYSYKVEGKTVKYVSQSYKSTLANGWTEELFEELNATFVVDGNGLTIKLTDANDHRDVSIDAAFSYIYEKYDKKPFITDYDVKTSLKHKNNCGAILYDVISGRYAAVGKDVGHFSLGVFATMFSKFDEHSYTEKGTCEPRFDYFQDILSDGYFTSKRSASYQYNHIDGSQFILAPTRKGNIQATDFLILIDQPGEGYHDSFDNIYRCGYSNNLYLDYINSEIISNLLEFEKDEEILLYPLEKIPDPENYADVWYSKYVVTGGFNNWENDENYLLTPVGNNRYVGTFYFKKGDTFTVAWGCSWCALGSEGESRCEKLVEEDGEYTVYFITDKNGEMNQVGCYKGERDLLKEPVPIPTIPPGVTYTRYVLTGNFCEYGNDLNYLLTPDGNEENTYSGTFSFHAGDMVCLAFDTRIYAPYNITNDGEYVFTIKVDSSGNVTSTSIREKMSGESDPNSSTNPENNYDPLILSEGRHPSVPEEILYDRYVLTGYFNSFANGSNYLLTPVENAENTYEGTFALDSGQGYVVAWDHRSTNMFGVAVSSNYVIRIVVDGNGDVVSLRIIDSTLPDNMTYDRYVLTGDFNGWANDLNYLLTPVENEENTYGGTFSFQEGDKVCVAWDHSYLGLWTVPYTDTFYFEVEVNGDGDVTSLSRLPVGNL